MDKYLKAAEQCYWEREGYSAGNMCGEYYVQLRDRGEGEHGNCPEMVSKTDVTYDDWKITGLNTVISGKGELPEPAEALKLLRIAKKK